MTLFIGKLVIVKESGDMMKTTGVVRRIDDLGRIVVPKEIRRTLRIRDGESLEIFVDKDIVALKKYSPMNDLEDFAKVLVEAVYQSLKSNIFITDRDRILAVAGPLKKKYNGKAISPFLENIIESRTDFDETKQGELELTSGVMENGKVVASTIMVSGDPIGLVFIFSENGSVNQTEQQIVHILAQFLGKHIEE